MLLPVQADPLEAKVTPHLPRWEHLGSVGSPGKGWAHSARGLLASLGRYLGRLLLGRLVGSLEDSLERG